MMIVTMKTRVTLRWLSFSTKPSVTQDTRDPRAQEASSRDESGQPNESGVGVRTKAGTSCSWIVIVPVLEDSRSRTRSRARIAPTLATRRKDGRLAGSRRRRYDARSFGIQGG